MRDKLIEQCLDILKRQDVKTELKSMFSPIVEMIISEIYPYIWLSLIFVIISFLLHLGIFFILISNKTSSLRI